MTSKQLLKLTCASLIFLFLHLPSFSNSASLSGDYELDDKTLYINKDEKFMTDSILMAFKKFWTITKIKYVDEEDILENLSDEDALVLTILTESYNSSATIYERKYFVIVEGKESVKSQEDYVRYKLLDDLHYKVYTKPTNKPEFIREETTYNINFKAAFNVKNVQRRVLIGNKKLEANTQKVYKGNYYYMDREEVKKKKLYILDSAVPKKFDVNMFCKKLEIDPSQVKIVSEQEIEPILYSEEDVLFALEASSYGLSFFSNRSGEHACELMSNKGSAAKNTNTVLTVLVGIGLLIYLVVAS